VTVGDCKLPRRGPFDSAKAAQIAADKIIKAWSSTPANPPTNDDTIVLNGVVTKIDGDAGRKFVVDCTRAAEGLLEDAEVRQKYEVSSDMEWQNIAENAALIKAIRDERARRVRTDQAARESAQQHFIKAPTVMNSIMSNTQANPRHRIEAAREIRAAATGGGDTENALDASEKFTIIFNLGGDIERYEKEITPKPTAPTIENNTTSEQE
jgi:hypothetical protein